MSDFNAALAAFIQGCQAKLNETYKDNSYCPVLSIDPNGKKFIRIVRTDSQTSVYCFVDKTNGDVLKAAGWKAPAKHARGNIFDETNGLSRIGPYGPEYLR